AFKIPNFLRRMFAEGAFAQGFVPVLSEVKTRRGPGEVRELVDHVAGSLGLVLFVLTAVAVVAAPLLIMLFAPGFIDDDGRFDLAAGMLRITFPYLLFISLTACAGGILNAYGRFAVPAFTPVLLNLALLGAAWWLAPRMAEPITALAWGVFVAGIAQLAFQLPFLARLGLLPRPRPNFRDPGVRRIMKLMAPALFGASVTQINLLVDTLIASFLVTGSVSWLYYSDRLVEFPLGVFGIAMATVILPSLSQRHAETDPAAFARTLDWALRWVLLVGTPCAVGLVVLAGPILATLFQYGAFTPADVDMASRSLMAYAVGLLGFILVKVLAPGYFARQDTKTPVKIGIVAMATNIVMNLVLVWSLAHAGLALATSIAAFVNAGLLYRGLRRGGVCLHAPGWRGLFARVVLANAALAALLWWGAGDLSDWFGWDAMSRTGHLVAWIAAGGVLYFGVLFASGVRPADLLGAPERAAADD
ncbi:MAG: murein biosynthesis integral membrane protein MurJ, partial [Gammaproteobacteria bacterium]|nr:murein biosynthesis integral membrane protein MurJ [Gammaproteobacteria bacterium]